MKDELTAHAKTQFDNFNYVLDFALDVLPNYDIYNGMPPAAPGVYIVRDENYNILYVGESVNIKKRLKSKKHPIRQIENFVFDRKKVISVVYDNDQDRWRAETILIGALAPLHNKVKYLHGMKAKR